MTQVSKPIGTLKHHPHLKDNTSHREYSIVLCNDDLPVTILDQMVVILAREVVVLDHRWELGFCGYPFSVTEHISW
jgi:hypothetical protein